MQQNFPTRKAWYYQLDPGRNMGKTNPLNDADLAEFVALQGNFADSAKSWSVDVAAVDATTLDEIAALDAEAAGVLASIRELL